MKLQIQFKKMFNLLISFSLIYMPGSFASAQATAAYTAAYNAGLAEAQKANPSLTQAQYNTNLNAFYAAVAAAQPKPATTTATRQLSLGGAPATTTTATPAATTATAAQIAQFDQAFADAKLKDPSLTRTQFDTNLTTFFTAVSQADATKNSATAAAAQPAATATPAPKFTSQQIENFKELETGYLEAVKKDPTLTREKFGSDLKGFKEAFEVIPSLSNNTWVANLFADGVSGTKDAGNIDTLIANAADPMTLFIQSQNINSLNKVDKKKLEVTLEAQALLANTMKYGAELGVLVNAGKYDEAFKFADKNGLTRVLVQADGLAAVGVKDMNATQMDAFFKAGGNNYSLVKELGPMFADRKWEQNRNMDQRAGQNIKALGGSGLPDYAWFNSDSANKGAPWTRSTLATIVVVAASIYTAIVAPEFTAHAISAATGAAATSTAVAAASHAVVGAAIAGATGGDPVQGAALGLINFGVAKGFEQLGNTALLANVPKTALDIGQQVVATEIANVSSGKDFGSSIKDTFTGNIALAVANWAFDVPAISTDILPSVREVAASFATNLVTTGGNIKDSLTNTTANTIAQTGVRATANYRADQAAAKIAEEKEATRLANEERAFTNSVNQALAEASLNIPTSVDGLVAETKANGVTTLASVDSQIATVSAQRARDAALFNRSQGLVNNDLENKINENLAPNLTANRNPAFDNLNLAVTAGLGNQLDDKFDTSFAADRNVASISENSSTRPNPTTQGTTTATLMETTGQDAGAQTTNNNTTAAEIGAAVTASLYPGRGVSLFSPTEVRLGMTHAQAKVAAEKLALEIEKKIATSPIMTKRLAEYGTGLAIRLASTNTFTIEERLLAGRAFLAGKTLPLPTWTGGFIAPKLLSGLGWGGLAFTGGQVAGTAIYNRYQDNNTFIKIADSIFSAPGQIIDAIRSN